MLGALLRVGYTMAPALHAIIRLNLKCLLGANNLAFFSVASVAKKKSFVKLTTGRMEKRQVR